MSDYVLMSSDVKEIVCYFSLSVLCFICGLNFSRIKEPSCYAFYVCAVASFILALVFFYFVRFRGLIDSGNV